MFYQDWRLSIVTFLVFPLSGLYVARTGRRMRKITYNAQTVVADYISMLSQTFQGMRHIKAYGIEKREEESSKSMNEAIYGLAVKGAII